jgi:tetratricopeptide (TPR) repeat protein
MRQAFELSDELSREERLFIEARHRTMMGEYDEAVEIFRALVSLCSDGVDYRLRLAYTLWEAGQIDMALETIEALKKIPGASENGRVDLAESRIAGAAFDDLRQLDAARRAARNARARGARRLLAEARLQESQVPLSGLGQAEAIGAAEEAVAIYRSLGDRFGIAKALLFRADLGDDPEEAREFRAESITLLQAVGANLEVVETKWRGR